MGWFQKEGLLFMPGNLQWKLVNSLHATTHLGKKGLQRLLERSFRGTGLQTTIRQVVSSCPTCQLNNPQGARRPQLAHPGEDWQMDFTQMPVSQGYNNLLVMIDTFTGWIEGFPTQTEKAEEVIKKKKKKTVFFFVLFCFVFMKSFQDLVIQSYNGPSFTFKVT